MLSTAMRGRLAVVLVGARNPQNIGAVARAMQDFGFTGLRVVNEFAPPFEAAQLEARSAVGAGEVMRSAQRFDSLADALADCGLVAGTTAIGDRALTQPVVRLQEAAPALLTALQAVTEAPGQSPGKSAGSSTSVVGPGSPPTRVALLFGSEKTGLTREQLSHCQCLLTIPLHAPAGRHLSMNLGQAAAVCLYELTREGLEGARPLPAPQPLPAAVRAREELLQLFHRVLELSGYTRRFPANARPEIVRQLILPLCRERGEAATWMGIFRHLLRTLTAPAGTFHTAVQQEASAAQGAGEERPGKAPRLLKD